MKARSLVLRHVCIFLDDRMEMNQSVYLALMDVGSNVLQAASKTVTKDIDNDPGAILDVC